jgi:hypothetical protein
MPTPIPKVRGLLFGARQKAQQEGSTSEPQNNGTTCSSRFARVIQLETLVYSVGFDCGTVGGLQQIYCLSGQNVTASCPRVQRIPQCLYWNATLQVWSDNGCKAVEKHDTRIRENGDTYMVPYLTCDCDHLTDFSGRFDAVATQQEKVFSKIESFFSSTDDVSEFPTIFIVMGSIVGAFAILFCVTLSFDSRASMYFIRTLASNPDVQLLARFEEEVGRDFYISRLHRDFDAAAAGAKSRRSLLTVKNIPSMRITAGTKGTNPSAFVRKRCDLCRRYVFPGWVLPLKLWSMRLLFQHTYASTLLLFSPTQPRVLRLLIIASSIFTGMFAAAFLYSYTQNVPEDEMAELEFEELLVLSLLNALLSIPIHRGLVILLRFTMHREFTFNYSYISLEMERRRAAESVLAKLSVRELSLYVAKVVDMYPNLVNDAVVAVSNVTGEHRSSLLAIVKQSAQVLANSTAANTDEQAVRSRLILRYVIEAVGAENLGLLDPETAARSSLISAAATLASMKIGGPSERSANRMKRTNLGNAEKRSSDVNAQEEGMDGVFATIGDSAAEGGDMDLTGIFVTMVQIVLSCLGCSSRGKRLTARATEEPLVALYRLIVNRLEEVEREGLKYVSADSMPGTARKVVPLGLSSAQARRAQTSRCRRKVMKLRRALPIRTWLGILGITVTLIWIGYCILYVTAFAVVVSEDVATAFLKSSAVTEAIGAFVAQPAILLFVLIMTSLIKMLIAYRHAKAKNGRKPMKTTDVLANLLLQDTAEHPLLRQLEYLVLTRAPASASMLTAKMSRSPAADAAVAPNGTVSTWIAQVLLSKHSDENVLKAKQRGNISTLLTSEYPLAARPLWEKLAESDEASSRAVLISAAYLAHRILSVQGVTHRVLEDLTKKDEEAEPQVVLAQPLPNFETKPHVFDKIGGGQFVLT